MKNNYTSTPTPTELKKIKSLHFLLLHDKDPTAYLLVATTLGGKGKVLNMPSLWTREQSLRELSLMKKFVKKTLQSEFKNDREITNQFNKTFIAKKIESEKNIKLKGILSSDKENVSLKFEAGQYFFQTKNNELIRPQSVPSIPNNILQLSIWHNFWIDGGFTVTRKTYSGARVQVFNAEKAKIYERTFFSEPLILDDTFQPQEYRTKLLGFISEVASSFCFDIF